MVDSVTRVGVGSGFELGRAGRGDMFSGEVAAVCSSSDTRRALPRRALVGLFATILSIALLPCGGSGGYRDDEL